MTNDAPDKYLVRNVEDSPRLERSNGRMFRFSVTQAFAHVVFGADHFCGALAEIAEDRMRDLAPLLDDAAPLYRAIRYPQ